MRYRLVSILAFIVFLASSSISTVDAAACKDHEYQTECAEDPSCTWDSGTGRKPHPGCKSKKTFVGCGSHSEFYCQANGCQWDSENRKCTGTPPDHWSS
jgi:hypothetical protein